MLRMLLVCWWPLSFLVLSFLYLYHAVIFVWYFLTLWILLTQRRQWLFRSVPCVLFSNTWYVDINIWWQDWALLHRLSVFTLMNSFTFECVTATLVWLENYPYPHRLITVCLLERYPSDNKRVHRVLTSCIFWIDLRAFYRCADHAIWFFRLIVWTTPSCFFVNASSSILKEIFIRRVYVMANFFKWLQR